MCISIKTHGYACAYAQTIDVADIACAGENSNCLPKRPRIKDFKHTRHNAMLYSLIAADSYKCPEGYGRCYGSKQCSLDYFFCDGDIDCNVGTDEDPAICRTYIATGTWLNRSVTITAVKTVSLCLRQVQIVRFFLSLQCFFTINQSICNVNLVVRKQLEKYRIR